MSGLAEIATVMISGAERRIDLTALNVSNMSTPGYRARRIFAELLDPRSSLPVVRELTTPVNVAAGMSETGNSLDFGTDVGSVMMLRLGDSVIYSRSAQLRRDMDGRLVDAGGYALQAIDGSDLVVSSNTPSVTSDGVVIVDGQPQGKIGLFAAPRAGMQAGGQPELAENGSVRQGMLVASSVVLADEMLELNKATRMAETGAKLFQVCDDLLAKVASQLGTPAR